MAQLKWDLKNFVIRSSVDYVHDLRQILKSYSADVILCDMGMLSGLFTAELTGLPIVVYSPLSPGLISRDTGLFGPGLLPNTSVLGRLRNRLLNWLIWYVILNGISREMNKVRMTLGLPKAKEPFFDIIARRADIYLQSGTPSIDYPRSDQPGNIHYIGPLIPDPPAGFVPPQWWGEPESGRRVILVTQGTLATDPHRIVIPSLRALADADVLVIVTTSGQSEEPEASKLPPNVRVEKFIPYSMLLPYVDVMVTNGGYGGTLMALSHGIPLVGSGRIEDKAGVCQRISWSGAGINLKSNSPKPAMIKKAVMTVLNNKKYKERAMELKKDFERYDAPTRAAELIENLVI